eukprot:TRINITY_DN6245_c0_g1_i2.p1 TRINITY_DN6245_c0_g1~~TRINITY_DN6245_c0_g1_i2.p1  ORF type:complete len:208 (+),score=86.92 TRINITY_DN6245_c0_g1_i2:425-1048(+)
MPTEFMTEKFVKDRKSLWPSLFDVEKMKKNRPIYLEKMRELLKQVEEKYAPKSENQQWILPGQHPTFADLNLGWTLKWALYQLRLKKEEGMRETDFPHLYRWLSRYAEHCKRGEKELKRELKGDEAKEMILNSKAEYQPVEHYEKESISIGTPVQIFATDCRDIHPQSGKIVAINQRETVIDLGNGLRMHHPRNGFKVVPEPNQSKL